MSSFFDSNILLYSLDIASPKRPLALKLVMSGGVISAQVLNEFTDVARRKYKASFADIGLALMPIREVCQVLPLTLEVHDRGVEIALVHLLRIYDACIVAAADLSGCDVLYTEDMNHGQRIGRVEIRNPFTE